MGVIGGRSGNKLKEILQVSIGMDFVHLKSDNQVIQIKRSLGQDRQEDLLEYLFNRDADEEKMK